MPTRRLRSARPIVSTRPLGPAAWPVLAAVFVAVVLAASGCGASAEPASPTTAPAPTVRVAPAALRAAPVPVQATGRLASKAEIQLAFKIDGVIERIAVDEGERVQRGATLARLHLAEIDARVLEAESGLAKARRDLERTRQLHRDSVATLEEEQNAETAVTVAEARLQAARFNRQYAVIEAPETGRILRRHAEAGEYVGPGRPIVTLGAMGRGWVVRAGLPAADVVRVALGDTAQVRLDAYPDQSVRATVTEIADAADPRTGTFEVELSVAAPDLTLKSGFIGRVRLTPSGAPPAVEVPATALVGGTGARGTVFRYDARTGTVHPQPVGIAQVQDSTIILREGLAAGTPIVVAGTQRLAAGDSVRVVP